jgi:transcriptional regulator with PAS, ATPase and Fis domain
MTTKPTYREMEQQVKELEKRITELERRGKILTKREERLREAEKMALLGHWELDLVNDTLYWSDEIYRIFNLPKEKFGATYDAFLNTIHPQDRVIVDTAYSDSVKNKTGYDIVHRLLLRDGTIKHVHEKCKTEYDKAGKAVRSLGTVQDITDRIDAENSFAGIVGRDAKMQEVFETIGDLADVDVPVIIQGESGTGKELVALAIHNEGRRAAGPFVPVNCGALPGELLESELFGHVRGAFTGAIRDKRGRFELAHGGTLFLDEIADLPRDLQVKLLRVLQEGKFEPVGGEKSISVDVRVISAANRDLKREIELGHFREDLYYRLKVVPILMPPLRERKSDIPLLVEYCLQKAAREGQYSEGVSRKAMSDMMEYPWPGNVRELQSALYYALIKSKRKTIESWHLPPEVMIERGEESSVPNPHPEKSKELSEIADDRKNKRDKKLNKPDVVRALAESDGNKVKAAKNLGIGRATLYRFLKTNKL